ncbi:amino acid ABC transporter permease [Pseudomonas sp. CBMAI 2609]|uniref:Amino acid ABC transporter permease n=1 Tax=Pseudomonas flavocrustae TaxID=2991719 RepID=A0ABT6IKA7_9PSED|nr:amino acid ABC transporter permease [Pseudomonas sp. CBMAI 2609]MDH4764045.1 amino acid ABC transporter permease [Pseudomonas sp. CBMAI 2609]
MAITGFELLWQAAPQLAAGAGRTLAIASGAILLASVLGLAYGIGRSLRRPWLDLLLRSYLELFRAIPVLVWLYLGFFGLPLLLGIDLPAFWCAVLVLGLWGATEIGEVVRGALASLPSGQREAGLAIGLDTAQLYRWVLLPQGLKRLTPGVINVHTRIIKTSSLTVLIGVVDVTKVSQQIIERTYESVTLYGFLFVFFFLLCYPLSCASRALERRWNHT